MWTTRSVKDGIPTQSVGTRRTSPGADRKGAGIMKFMLDVCASSRSVYLIPLATQSPQFLDRGKRLELVLDTRRVADHADDEELAARLADHVADDGQVEPVAAVERSSRRSRLPRGSRVPRPCRLKAPPVNLIGSRMVSPLTIRNSTSAESNVVLPGPGRVESSKARLMLSNLTNRKHDGQLAEVPLGDVRLCPCPGGCGCRCPGR